MSKTPAPTQVLGDPTVPWVVVLDASTSGTPPTLAALRERLAGLAAEAGWPLPATDAVRTGDRRTLLRDLCSASPQALRVGVHDGGIVLSARHELLDGLAMLEALGRLLGREVRSAVRGVDASGRTSQGAGALVKRAWELAMRPPRSAARSLAGTETGDAFAVRTVDGAPRTAELVHGGARAIAAWNRAHRTSARRLSVAVGVSTVPGTDVGLGDHSAFLRLREVETLTLEEVRHQLGRAPLQLGGFHHTPPRGLGGMTRTLLRAAAPRLGSTLLVSHLGAVSGPEELDRLAFFPVTGGRSGLSLGAVTMPGRTTLTLRARATRFDDEGLQALLALVVDELG